jgi:hypothetical protein
VTDDLRAYERHDIESPSVPASRWDPLSFGAGAVFFALALTVLLGGGHGLLDNAGWVVPVALIAVGLLGIDADRRLRRRG